MVFEDVLVALKGLVDGIAGVGKTILDFQHGNPLAFAIVAVLIFLLIGGFAIVQGKSITAMIVGDYEIVSDVPLWDQYNLTGRPNVTQFSLVMASGWFKGWEGWKNEDISTDDISTELYLRWAQTMCSDRLNETSGTVPVVWEEVILAEATNLLFSGDEMVIKTRCGGLTSTIHEITFVDELDALNTITSYGENGTICSDDIDLTIDIVYNPFGTSCFFLIDEQNRRIFYQRPFFNQRNNYKWVPVFKSVVSSLSQGTSYLVLEKLETTPEQAGIFTGFISVWIGIKNIVRTIETTVGLPPFASGLMGFMEGGFIFVTLIIFGLIGIAIILTIGSLKRS